MAKIIISEEQCGRLFEDVRWSDNGNGGVDMTIGQDKTDAMNIGNKRVDTRVFGNKQDILYGDGTSNGKVSSLSDTVLSRRALITTYTNFIEFLKGNWRNDNINTIFQDKNCPQKTVTAIKNYYNDFVKGRKTKEEIIASVTKNLEIAREGNLHKDALYTKVINDKSDEKIARYTKFKIPNTNVYCLALFSMGSFDLSDAMKKGSLRGSSVLFGSDGIKDSSEYNDLGNGRVGVTYDGGITPNISSNFSLNGTDYGENENGEVVNNGNHYKQSFGYNGQDSGSGKYTSVNQFLDKSIIYAKYALTKEEYKPDYIITAPSSSRMNEYYAINLSQKIGVPYLKDFFKRDIVHAHFANGLTDEDLINDGFSHTEILKLKNKIKTYAYNEITYEIERPLRDLINSRRDLFENIPIKKSSREKVPTHVVLNILSKHSFEQISPFVSSNDGVLGKVLCKNFINLSKNYQDGEYKNVLPVLINLINTKIGRGKFGEVLGEMLRLFRYYKQQVQKGYRPSRYGKEQSKITSLDKRERKYVEGSFIIADKYVNKGGDMYNRFKNADFLIVDEDVNSGGTFKLVIDALKMKLPDVDSGHILCLANGFSERGR